MWLASFPDLRHVPLTPFQLTSGRYPGVGEIVMEYGDTSIQHVAIGDTVTLDSPTGTAALKVVGIARTPGEDSSSGASLGYMSDAGLSALVGAAGAPGNLSGNSEYRHLIQVKVYNTRQANATADTVQATLQQHGVTVFQRLGHSDGPDVGTIKAIDGIFSLLRLLSLLAVVMSAFLLFSTITSLVTEQMREIGTMKALGAQRGEIMRDYLITVGLYSVIGTAAGIVLGLAGGYELAVLLGPKVPLDIGPFHLKLWIVLLSLGVGLILPLLAALAPIWNGTRVSVRTALAAYGVSGGKRPNPLTPVTSRLRWIRQTTWLGLRGLFRRRLRAGLTLLTVAIAGACFLIVQTTAVSVSQTVAAAHNTFDFDVSVFAGPQASYQQTLGELASVPNIAHIERYGQTNASTKWGTVQVLGFEPQTKMYHYQLTSGRWLQSDDINAVLISDDVTHRTGLHVGDTLTLAGSKPLRIVGTLHQHIDNLGWIGAVVVSVNTANMLNGVSDVNAPNATIWLAVQAINRSPAAVSSLANQLDATLASHSTVAQGSPDSPYVETHHTILARSQKGWFVLYYVLYAVALVVGVAGSIGLANALASSVLERRREIGVMRAMGATGRRVASVFWIEGLALGMIAWLLGMAIGLPLARGFVAEMSNLVMPIDFHLNLSAFAVMLVATLAIATLAGVAPTWRASRVRVADLLRYE
jgi:putative ABC transport system permease protein